MIQKLAIRWAQWKAKRQQRIVERYRNQRLAILQRGIHLYADVLACYDTNLAEGRLHLVRLRLSIPTKGRHTIETFSTTFTTHQASELIGKRLRISFLAGDMSHIVVRG